MYKIMFFGIKINKVEGNFNCSDNNLTSLEFCPKIVEGNFYCSDNNLTSLEFCPEEVNGYFDCSHNKLISLEFCPEIVEGNFDCSNNPELLKTYGSKENIEKWIKEHCKISGDIYV